MAALDGGSSKSGVCLMFRVARSTLNDTLERIGWSGATQHGSKKLKKAQRPREQERRKRLSREERECASSLRQCLGVEVGVRRSAAQIGEQLPAHDRKNGRMGELVSKITSSFAAEGLAELAPGPRGGAGWSLTKKGKALIDKVYATGLSRTSIIPSGILQAHSDKRSPSWSPHPDNAALGIIRASRPAAPEQLPSMDAFRSKTLPGTCAMSQTHWSYFLNRMPQGVRKGSIPDTPRA